MAENEFLVLMIIIMFPLGMLGGLFLACLMSRDMQKHWVKIVNDMRRKNKALINENFLLKNLVANPNNIGE